MTSSFFKAALLSINEWRVLIVNGSTGLPGVRLFSGLVLFFVITIQVAAAGSRSTK